MLKSDMMKQAPTRQSLALLLRLVRRTNSKRTLAEIRYYLAAWGEYRALILTDWTARRRFRRFMSAYGMSENGFWNHIEGYLPKNWRNA